MYTILAQVWLIPLVAATSQAEGGVQNPAAHTPEQRVQVDQIPEVIPVSHVTPDQPEDRAAALEEEQRRLERFKKYKPPTFSGLASDDALGFLEECYRILRTIGISGSSGGFFHCLPDSRSSLSVMAYFKLDSPVEAASLTWNQFSDMFLREYVP
uniref:Uncharacterized protein LOC104239605 n=1 Tax=Nicotiana sylvestris TaxID=4096 RepID=A0A1U7Y024_NICSY|nr:PREDICTED: uncharacterized protein LOC104239605 [Nicotiana sylvestris]XP_009792585.1 PREDICTED: uncharacterized protein LOC104239605 [Nicotiana sylvestris]